MQHNRSQRDFDEASVVTTAGFMADATGYLIRVAAKAGLHSIAGKLANVRESLLAVAAGETEDDAQSHSRSTLN